MKKPRNATPTAISSSTTPPSSSSLKMYRKALAIRRSSRKKFYGENEEEKKERDARKEDKTTTKTFLKEEKTHIPASKKLHPPSSCPSTSSSLIPPLSSREQGADEKNFSNGHGRFKETLQTKTSPSHQKSFMRTKKEERRTAPPQWTPTCLHHPYSNPTATALSIAISGTPSKTFIHPKRKEEHGEQDFSFSSSWKSSRVTSPSEKNASTTHSSSCFPSSSSSSSSSSSFSSLSMSCEPQEATNLHDEDEKEERPCSPTCLDAILAKESRTKSTPGEKQEKERKRDLDDEKNKPRQPNSKRSHYLPQSRKIKKKLKDASLLDATRTHTESQEETNEEEDEEETSQQEEKNLDELTRIMLEEISDRSNWTGLISKALEEGRSTLPRSYPREFKSSQYRRIFSSLPMSLPLLEMIEETESLLKQALDPLLTCQHTLHACQECEVPPDDLRLPEDLLPHVSNSPSSSPPSHLRGVYRRYLWCCREKRVKLLHVLEKREKMLKAYYEESIQKGEEEISSACKKHDESDKEEKRMTSARASSHSHRSTTDCSELQAKLRPQTFDRSGGFMMKGRTHEENIHATNKLRLLGERSNHVRAEREMRQRRVKELQKRQEISSCAHLEGDRQAGRKPYPQDCFIPSSGISSSSSARNLHRVEKSSLHGHHRNEEDSSSLHDGTKEKYVK
ncbi:hypothetical protein CSUI_007575 [Cystoisospora suis]|uniref:Uncharacterized protein n=1 Tax=Cystoisospora suis TaxID=483139 RepID=A0A2C6KM42_9APIC|nr:hypothetical protein CSUI_007575 [Cystoisospora suis]